jgi:truncated hemoglobin YjbI/plastocyanin
VKKLAVLACILMACGGKAKQPSTPRTEDAKSAKTTDDAKAAQDTDAGKPKPKASASLYDRLGGREAITAVTGEFLDRVAADARIKYRFLNTDMGKLKTLLIEFVCMATGGPVKYTGQDMETSHAGMELVAEEFTALVEDLAGALDKFKVPAKEKGELLGALGPLQPQMVTPPDRLKPVSEAAIAKATAVAVKLTNEDASDLMQAAIVAAKRGQRNYADQLFSRVESLVGANTVAAAAPTFRDGAPPRIETPLKKMPKDTPAQPKIAGNSDEDEPNARRPASLKGTVTVDGQPLNGLGTVMLFPADGGGKKRRPKQRVVEQRNKEFLPHVLAVPPGSTVAFPNFDGIYHNVFSLSATKKFDVGLYKDGDTRELKFEKPGIVRLACNIHAKMSAYILVVDAPHYVVVDGAKEFNFRSLAPGKYKVRAWSERSAAPMESEILINPGVNTVSFDVKGDAEPGPSEDKFGMTRQPIDAAPKR